MRFSRPVYFLVRSSLGVLCALPLTAGLALAQWTTPASVVRDGVQVAILPSASITTAPSGVVSVQLTGIQATVDRQYGVIVDGKRYGVLDFDGALVPYFNAIQVRTLSLRLHFTGAQNCTANSVSFATWRVGGAETMSCAAGSDARLERYEINGFTASGILELQSRVRQLVAERARSAQQQGRSLSAARPPSVTDEHQAPTATPPVSAQTSSELPGFERERAERERQRQLAEAQREQQRHNAERARLANEAATATSQMAYAWGAVFADAAEARRRRAAAEGLRMAALEDRYYRHIAARHERAGAWRVCATDDIATNSLSNGRIDVRAPLSLSNCRTADGRPAALYRVMNPTGKAVKIHFYPCESTEQRVRQDWPTALVVDVYVEGRPVQSTPQSCAKNRFIVDVPKGAETILLQVTTERRGEVGDYRLVVR